jgi:hypothetical protein
VRNVPAGAKVGVRCAGKGCPRRRSQRRAFKRPAASARVGGFLRRVRLRRGARVTVRLAAPGGRVRTWTWTMTRKPGRPRRKLG